MKKIQPLISFPSLLSVALLQFQPSLIHAMLFLPVFGITLTDKVAAGETTLYLTYIFSIIPFPVQGFLNLLTFSGLYILIQEVVLSNEKNYPLAPGFMLAYIATLITVLA